MDIKQINESILLCFHQFYFETLLHYRVEVDSSMARNQPTFLIASHCFREACNNSPMKCCFMKVKSPNSFDWTAVRSFESAFQYKILKNVLFAENSKPNIRNGSTTL